MSNPEDPDPRMGDRRYRLILVEDSEDDTLLFELNLRRANLHETFEIVRRFSRGEDAIDYFQNRSRTLTPEPHPNIVLLDIKLPGFSGFDVLKEIAPLTPRPIIAVYTSSGLEEDKQKAEQLGADFFQTKLIEPAQFSRFLLLLAHLADGRPKPT